ncbi:regulatory protein, luxR family [Desulfacinum hydrothermale DSM 13146]|uniref:Regulatory protein, luxR family n=1 Tax=Desulfacinum hydrothermale DSM 13146 TaxID=1121390 RepID=A0A1W1XSC6_9BACT|nr:LuxR C-terminal-related transcriptional regulator [Desulfacinum hydrothermale]SMC26752.1 regulatory protein, luxR family [Desulfacinum hydrothermale DSM 13146]
MTLAESQDFAPPRVLFIDPDPKAHEDLLAAALPAEFYHTPEPVPPRENPTSFHLVVVAEDFLDSQAIRHWIQRSLHPYRHVLVGLSREPSGSPNLPRWAQGYLERPYRPDQIHRHLLEVLCQEPDGLTRRLKQDVLSTKKESLERGHRKLESLHDRLLEGQRALQILAQRRLEERREALEHVRRVAGNRLIPLLRDMQQDPDASEAAVELEQLMRCVLRGLEASESVEGRAIHVLSPVELRVAVLIRLGLNGRDIARRLGVSMGTVQTHRKNIRKKLGIHGRHYSLRHCLLGGSRPGRPSR